MWNSLLWEPPWPRGSVLGLRPQSSLSSHHPQEALLAQFSLYVHKGGLKPYSFHLPRYGVVSSTAMHSEHTLLNQRLANVTHAGPALCRGWPGEYSTMQSQKAVSAYFTSKQILPFGFVEQYRHIGDDNWAYLQGQNVLYSSLDKSWASILKHTSCENLKMVVYCNPV